MEKRRVVITGMGAVSPIGRNTRELWTAIRNHKCGVDRITLFDPSSSPVQIAAEVKNFNPSDHGISPKKAYRMGRFTQFLLAASNEAVRDANLDGDILASDKTGVIAGSAIGGMDVIDQSFNYYVESGKRKISPFDVARLIPNESAANVSMELGITGCAWVVSSACASGTDSVGLAFKAIRYGDLDVCLAGGSESCITDYVVKGFASMRALTTCYNNCPQKASRPFDRDRSGFVMGEGGAVLVLEELEHAKARGARIYAELAGYGASADAYHITSPRPNGTVCARAVRQALQEAGVSAESVDYYNAHGTSTVMNDSTESKMLLDVFGDHARTKMKISSTKGMTGHCIGAAGTLEAIISAMAIYDSYYPANINCDNQDENCDINLVDGLGFSGNIDCAVSASLGFGGHNGVLVLKKYRGD
ncbi:MAG: beta-ketoacyl-ACP synthase II [Fibrobacter sp.]|nr:beta-ketoacyl-ACP synthase II [Fibrobacter sp.]